MQKTIILLSFLVLVTFSQCASQRSDRTSTGKAAYGVATVSKSGRIGRTKKVRGKSLKAKARKAKSTPAYRKKDPWAG